MRVHGWLPSSTHIWSNGRLVKRCLAVTDTLNLCRRATARGFASYARIGRRSQSGDGQRCCPQIHLCFIFRCISVITSTKQAFRGRCAKYCIQPNQDCKKNRNTNRCGTNHAPISRSSSAPIVWVPSLGSLSRRCNLRFNDAKAARFKSAGNMNLKFAGAQ
jgi:hypothetical protein